MTGMMRVFLAIPAPNEFSAEDEPAKGNDPALFKNGNGINMKHERQTSDV